MKPSLLALSCLPFAVSALKLPVRQTKRDSFGVAYSTSNANNSTGHIIGISDFQDVMYIANITIAGQSYPVILDTGSSDLWIGTLNGSVPGVQSNFGLNISYVSGYANGPIATAPVSFAGFDIPTQAYVAAQNANNPALPFGAQGVLGMSFPSGSSIDSGINQTGGSWGRSLLFNVFAQNPSEPNFIAFFLQRNDDPNNGMQGSFTIGEYDQRYAAVANTAPIPTFPEKSPNQWHVLVDSIMVNGKNMSVRSDIQGVPPGKSAALLDTGTSFVFAPKDVVTAMYGSIPGAQYNEAISQWNVPCDAEVNVSIIIAGRKFDIHPLDTVQPVDVHAVDAQVCVGGWTPGSNDMILGDAAQRSFYTVYDYGDFDSNHNMGDPYVRLLSLVNSSEASAEFQRVRGGTAQNTFLSNVNANAAPSNANSSDASGTPSSNIDDLNTKVNNIMKWAPIAIGLTGFNVLVIIIVLIVSIIGCVRRRRNVSMAPTSSFVPLPLGAGAHDYRPVSLQETSKYNPGARYSD